MKYLTMTLLGLVIGIAAAGALLYYNPLTQALSPPLASERLVLEYEFPGTDSLVMTHAGTEVLPQVSAGVGELWESTVKGLMLSVVELKDPDGTPRAVASRVSLPSQKTDLLLEGVIVTDYWLVTVPGEGSFFVEADNNLWPFVKDVFVPVRYLGQELNGPAQYEPTVGPRAGKAAGVFGATGRYQFLDGTGRETYRVESFSQARGFERVRGRLHLDFAVPEQRAEELSQADLE